MTIAPADGVAAARSTRARSALQDWSRACIVILHAGGGNLRSESSQGNTLTTHAASQMASAVAGAGHETHQRTEALRGRHPNKVQPRYRRFHSVRENGITLVGADLRQKMRRQKGMMREVEVVT